VLSTISVFVAYTAPGFPMPPPKRVLAELPEIVLFVTVSPL
jgi:hypothetical protein